MQQSRCSARLRGIRVPDIPISVHDRSGVREIAVQAAAIAEVAAATVEVVLAKSSHRRRRWRTGVFPSPSGSTTYEPEASTSEDSLFNELTREDPETPVCESDIMEDETPTWICEAEQSEIEVETMDGYEADEEATEDEPCFTIDLEGECFWLDDDDLSCDDEFQRW